MAVAAARTAPGRALGTVFIAVSLGLFASRIPFLGNWGDEAVFYLLAAITVVSAMATVTFRKPVYSAIWFGMSLLGTAACCCFKARSSSAWPRSWCMPARSW